MAAVFLSGLLTLLTECRKQSIQAGSFGAEASSEAECVQEIMGSVPRART